MGNSAGGWTNENTKGLIGSIKKNTIKKNEFDDTSLTLPAND
jgi:hypothetical protein